MMKISIVFILSSILELNTLVLAGNSNSQLLINAAKDGNEEEVKRILQLPETEINSRDSQGKTALIWAAYTGNEEIVQLLLEKFADVKVKANDGSTALLLAIR